MARATAQTDAAELRLLRARATALSRAMATIEFALDGTVVDANENFLGLMGYRLDEVVGRHHRMFVDPVDAAAPSYAAFWERLRAGEAQTAQFRRLAKGGREVWIEASYTPTLDDDGIMLGVVKIATDITARKQQSLDVQGQLAAISWAMAVVEFDLQGTVLDCNENFTNAFGYTRDEVVGRSHRHFVSAEYAASDEYATFWQGLRDGHEQAGEFVRVGKDGRHVVLHATYSPIFNTAGRPYKVVKYATDVTMERARDAESHQIRTALDSSKTNMMIANERFEITYVNDAMRALLADAETDIRKDLPHFSAASIVGTKIDVFHKEPARVREMLQRLTGPHQVRVALGGRRFELGASMARDGDRIVGFAVEWIDVTARMHEQEVVQAEVNRVVRAALEGDLRQRIDVTAFLPGFLREMSGHINELLDSVGVAFASVKETASEIGLATNQLRFTSQQMTTSSEQLTSASSTSADALAQVALAVGDNAEAAASARKVVTTMATAAGTGAQRVAELREAMNGISSSSRQVMTIIKAIDEIAFQTNLLALNAAIEAARAGRHGKGFAVVAKEVRSLAVRSAEAAQETARLIQDAVRKVGDGVVVANATDASLAEIAGSVQRVVDLVGAIATSSAAQARSLVDVNAAVSQVSIGAQAGSQQSLEVATSAEQLARQMEQLLKRTQRYQVPALPIETGSTSTVVPSEALLNEIAALVRQHTPLRRAS